MRFNGNKGFTLIEIILAVAILGIISVSMLQIFTNTFSNILKVGDSSKNFYDSQSEIEIARQNFAYTGKGNNNVIFDDTSFEIFDTIVKGYTIKVKQGDITQTFVEEDDYLSTFVIDNPLGTYVIGEAFIDLNGDLIFNGKDIHVPPSKLDGNYTHYGKGRLVLPAQNAFVVSPVTHQALKWIVDGGIYIEKGIQVQTTNSLNLVCNENIEINEVNIRVQNQLKIKSNKKILASSSTLDSSKNVILIADDELFIHGTNLIPSSIFTGSGYNLEIDTPNAQIIDSHYNVYSLYNSVNYNPNDY